MEAIKAFWFVWSQVAGALMAVCALILLDRILRDLFRSEHQEVGSYSVRMLGSTWTLGVKKDPCQERMRSNVVELKRRRAER